MFKLLDNADFGPNTYGRDNKTRHTGEQLDRAELSATIGDHDDYKPVDSALDEHRGYMRVASGANYGYKRKSYEAKRFTRYTLSPARQRDNGSYARGQMNRQAFNPYSTPVGTEPRPYYGTVLNPYVRLDLSRGNMGAVPTTVRNGLNEMSVNIPYGIRRDDRY